MDKKIKYLKKREKKVIEAFIKDIREKFGNYILSIRLFGSKVKGNFEKYSDIDIFILIKENNGLRDKISDIAADYFLEYNIPISPVVYSLFEYKKNKELGSFFFKELEKEGILL